MRKLAAVAFLGAMLAAFGAASGEDLPQFPEIQLFDLSGQPTILSNVLGRATVINFWATWCAPCREELPELQHVYNDMAGKGLAVLAVDVDTPMLREGSLDEQLRGLRPRIDAFARGMNISLPIYVVDGRTQAQLGVETIPMTVLLDGKGRVVRVYAGFSQQGMGDLRKEAAAVLNPQGGKGGH
jgi:thiol-disulfide isomerase/thioredoxin